MHDSHRLTRSWLDDVCEQAFEGLKWLQLAEIGDESSPTAKMVKKLVFERRCPINSVRAPF